MKIILMGICIMMLAGCAAILPPLIEVVEEAIVLEANEIESK